MAGAADWFYKNFNGGGGTHEGAAPTANFPAFSAPQVALESAAQQLKFKATTNPVDFSFDGKNVHGTILPADGLVSFEGVNKSKIWFKGTGTIQVYAWHAG